MRTIKGIQQWLVVSYYFQSKSDKELKIWKEKNKMPALYYNIERKFYYRYSIAVSVNGHWISGSFLKHIHTESKVFIAYKLFQHILSVWFLNSRSLLNTWSIFDTTLEWISNPKAALNFLTFHLNKAIYMYH